MPSNARIELNMDDMDERNGYTYPNGNGNFIDGLQKGRTFYHIQVVHAVTHLEKEWLFYIGWDSA